MFISQKLFYLLWFSVLHHLSPVLAQFVCSVEHRCLESSTHLSPFASPLAHESHSGELDFQMHRPALPLNDKTLTQTSTALPAFSTLIIPAITLISTFPPAYQVSAFKIIPLSSLMQNQISPPLAISQQTSNAKPRRDQKNRLFLLSQSSISSLTTNF